MLQDLRYGVRVLLKAPAFTAVAVITLALGIGANTSIFSVLNAAMIRTLPVRNPEGLAIVGDPTRVHSFGTGSPRTDLYSAPLYEELRRAQTAFDGLAATGYLGPAPMVSIDQDRQATLPERATARLVSANFFSVLGVDPLIGRVFRSDAPSRPGGDPEAVVGYQFWKNRLGRDTAAVGRVVRVNGYPLTVIGVMPPSFTGEVVGDSVDVWVPMTMQAEVMPGDRRLDDAGASWLLLIGRLKPGVSLEQARAGLQVTYEHIAESSFAAQFEANNQTMLRQNNVVVSSGARGLSRFRERFSKPLSLLMAIVALVLLIASINVANLMLARATSRKKEIAIRLALGASGSRIVRQLLTESVLTALVGGALGLLFAQWGTAALLAIAEEGGAVPLDTSPDLLVLAFTLTVCVGTGVLFGLVPALRSRRMELTSTLTSASRGESSSAGGGPRWATGRLMVAAQVALSVVVLFSAGKLVQSLRNLHAIDTGYEREHLLMLSVNPRSIGYTGAGYIGFCDQILEKIRALPGVAAATYSENGLFSGSESNYSIDVPGFERRPQTDRNVAGDTIGPDYFSSIGIPLRVGRGIGLQDLGGMPKVAVINETMARFYFGSLNPIGRTFHINSQEYGNSTIQVVGVSHDARDHDLRAAVPRRFYIPVGLPNLPAEVQFEIRTINAPRSVEAAVRRLIAAISPQLNIVGLTTVNELVDAWMKEQIFVARLSGFFAVLALVLSAVGLYGVTAYAVSGRTREIGVRLALGANPGEMVWMIVREGLLLVSAGLLVGLPAAVAGARLLGSLLYAVSPVDLTIVTSAVGVLAAVGAAAAYLPARRAASVDPMIALRYE